MIRGMTFLLGAAASTWMIYDLSTAAEAPSHTLAVLKYTVLAILLIGTIYSGVKWLTMR
jgi:hypothetical protein